MRLNYLGINASFLPLHNNLRLNKGKILSLCILIAQRRYISILLVEITFNYIALSRFRLPFIEGFMKKVWPWPLSYSSLASWHYSSKKCKLCN